VSIDQSVRLQAMTEKITAEFPEVAYTFSKLGTSEIANDPMGVHQADTYAMLKPMKDWPKVNGQRRDKAQVAAAMIERLEAELPGQSVLLSQPIQMRFNDLLEGSKADVSVKLFGDDMDQLASLTRKLAASIGKVKGAEELEVELRGTSPLLQVTPKTNVLREMGGSSRDVLDAVGVALGGGDAGFVYEGVRRFPLVVRLPESRRSDLDTIRSLPVGIGPNLTVPLERVADVRFTQTYGTILREQGKRRAAVMINPRGRDTESFVREAQRVSAAEVPLPTGYYVEWSGTFQNLIEARKRLIVLAPVALLLVLMMIFAVFKNIAQTVIVFLCVPMALVGGVLGLMGNGLPFSISAGVGFIALSGIAVMNGVVLMSYINELRREGMRGAEVARKAALLRLRPVMMTALVDVFGFLPMMLSSGIGSEVQKPLASVVIGGIVSSTALTLLLLPAAYVLLERVIDRFEPENEEMEG
jgi:heavy metal efflux system protein